MNPSEFGLVKKPSVFLTSLGRTGTLSLKYMIETTWPGIKVFHEPDVMKFYRYPGIKQKIFELKMQFNEIGAKYLILNKILGKWGLASVSDKRFTGNITDREAVAELYEQRAKFVVSRPQCIYIESNFGLYGLIDLFPKVFEKQRVVFVIRDARYWIQSWMNWGEMHSGHLGGMYGKRGVARLIGHKWPTAADMPSDDYSMIWEQMSQFERLCWAWSRMNHYAIEQVKINCHARIYRFEDIFLGSIDALSDLIEFCGSISSCLDYSKEYLAKIQFTQKQKSRGDFPGWSSWSKIEKRQFEEICGPLMNYVGYRI